jgi:hypothetical protein
MNLHPALLAVIVVDLLAATALLAAAFGAVRVTLGWNGGAPTTTQLSLERRKEEVSFLGRLGLVLHAFGTLTLLLVINHVLPSIVPGAMCGVGALQAMPGGQLALVVRGVALAVLWVWAVVDSLDRSAPLAPLATASSRALLVSAPVAWVAAWQTGNGLLHVDVQQPVSCCAAVYDLAVAGSSSGQVAVAGTTHAMIVGVGVALLAAVALWMRWRGKRRLPSGLVVVWVLAMMAWVGLAGWVMVDVAGPYLYGVLGHRCPLCFFLPHHLGVGYAAYGLLAVVMGGTLTLAASTMAGARCRDIEPRARSLVSTSTLWVVAAMGVFLILIAAPAVIWRIRFDVWIGG